MTLATDFDIVVGWPDTNVSTSQGSKFDIIVGIQTHQFLSDSYGTDWAGTGGSTDVSTTLPSTPSDGKDVLRYNTDLTELRRYTYDSVQWTFESISGGGLTTPIEGITSIGAGTPIDYGTAPRTHHTMQIVGQTNTGTFTSCSVNFEISLNGIDFDSFHTIELTAAGNEIYFTPPASAVKVRYNVTELTVIGDADLDVTITST